MNKYEKMKLLLEDGSAFQGVSFGYPASGAGEVVFNTAMTGYPESLTDPSFRGQILVSTYPMIGNYGVSEAAYKDGLIRNFESEAVQVTGLVILDYSEEYSHWSASKSLGTWLRENRVPAMYGIDTRAITKILREKGTMLGKMIYEDTPVDWIDPNKSNIVDQVSIRQPQRYGEGRHAVVLVDCGVKCNILRCLLQKDTTVLRVPWDYDFTEERFDGIFVSNGPGDPKRCTAAVGHLRKAMGKKQPIFGICLGTQLMALAAGMDTYKLPYGHRGHNQPVIDLKTQRCYITSQNHGFAVDPQSIPDDWELSFVNINDGTCEGVRHRELPFFSAQFHPEASGGPTDTRHLFDEFIAMIGKNR